MPVIEKINLNFLSMNENTLNNLYFMEIEICLTTLITFFQNSVIDYILSTKRFDNTLSF